MPRVKPCQVYRYPVRRVKSCNITLADRVSQGIPFSTHQPEPEAPFSLLRCRCQPHENAAPRKLRGEPPIHN
eukprot:1124376-Karenia_brevis.AAC.1